MIYRVEVDDIIAYEGCQGDDLTMLGGRENFLSHFWTFFNFNACYGIGDRKASKKLEKLFSDPLKLNEKMNDMLKDLN